MTRAIFDKLVDSIVGNGEGVLFETSYGSFYLYTYNDGAFRLELSYKYVCGLDGNLAPIYQYMDDYVWAADCISRDKLYSIINKILVGDPYGTDYSRRKAQKNIKGEK